VRVTPLRYVHVLLHGIRNGIFSMRSQWAESRGEDRAARFIESHHLLPINISRWTAPRIGAADSDALGMAAPPKMRAVE